MNLNRNKSLIGSSATHFIRDNGGKTVIIDDQGYFLFKLEGEEYEDMLARLERIEEKLDILIKEVFK